MEMENRIACSAAEREPILTEKSVGIARGLVSSAAHIAVGADARSKALFFGITVI